nr:hypothetical protein [Tanacetum cinerariifolium]
VNPANNHKHKQRELKDYKPSSMTYWKENRKKKEMDNHGVPPTKRFVFDLEDNLRHEDSNDENSNDEVWSAVVGWEIIPTPLGEINALYRIDGSTKHFTTLCQILHMVDRQDLVTLYGLVVQYYENHHVAGTGLIF